MGLRTRVFPKTNMIRLNIAPLSVNKAWQGRRFKTDAYNKYERDVLLMLPMIKLPPSPFKVTIGYGFSNKGSDIDNPTKLVFDILQKKYKFNDSAIYELVLTKNIVKKGNEYFEFKIETQKSGTQ